MNDPAQAVAQVTEGNDWDESLPPLPTDYLGLFMTAMPLVGMALVFGFLLIRSLP